MHNPTHPGLRPRMPFLLAAALGIFAAAAAWSCWLILTMVVGDPTFDVNGQPADVTQLIRRLAAPLGIFCLVSGGVVYGLRFERSWSRVLILFWWVAALALDWVFVDATSPGSYTLTAAAYPVFGLVASIVYLYAKQSVRDYYSTIAAGKYSDEAPSIT